MATFSRVLEPGGSREVSWHVKSKDPSKKKKKIFPVFLSLTARVKFDWLQQIIS